jgi:hypothetical protein
VDSGILHPDVQRFIRDHLNDPVSTLALSKNPFPGTQWQEILAQVAASAKAKEKLPTWFASENIYYPPKLSVEQASSEETARYKASLVSGKSLADATGGFGVDDFFFSKSAGEVTHCESDPELSGIAAHNFRQLGADNIDCIAGDSSEFFHRTGRDFDWIYADPARRHDKKGKVFRLSDCRPNVPELLDLYFSKAENVMVKTAPLLDMSAGLAELRHTAEIHIVALRNEVKELLWILRRGFAGAPVVKAANLPQTETFDFIWGENAQPDYRDPGKYLYEPNAAVMKSGAFGLVAARFGIGKLSRHAHLYTSDEPADGFPGRRFSIERVVPYQKKDMMTLGLTKANVTARHFPETVDAIRKKWKIADGGSLYAFFTTGRDDLRIVLLCKKI